jgi:hypothetical protein
VTVHAAVGEINEFLIESKSLIAAKKVDFIPRPKNNLTNLGISLKIALHIILNLTYQNYFNGPEQDNNTNYAGFIWEFGKDEEKYQVYIKLKIKDTNRGKLLCIMGFHKADFPIKYLYK